MEIKIKNIKKALAIARQVIEGKEYVMKSPVAGDFIYTTFHPFGGMGCTREELYYGVSSRMGGTEVSVPQPAKERPWRCVECHGIVTFNNYEDEETNMYYMDTRCPCGSVSEDTNGFCEEGIVASLREKHKVY